MGKNKGRHYRRSMKIPILPTMGIAAGLTASLNDRYSIVKSLMEHGLKGHYTDFGSDLMVQTIGLDPRTKTFKIPTFTVTVAASVMAQRLMNRFARGAFKGLPIRW